jgi:hypothetical protein
MSLAEDHDLALDAGPLVFELALEAVTLGDSVRSQGLDRSHVDLLVELGGRWSPILVWGPQNLVVDGAHRVEAARRLGLNRVGAVRFTGTADDAYLESVRRNIDHGLPLSLEDRRRAARRILSRHAEWSDRRIAALCGLSGKTVARLRRDLPEPYRSDDGVVIGMNRRVGKDGKARPVRAAEVRDRIRLALDQNPQGSLRSIAATAGASPETVRSVRARIQVVGNPPEAAEVAPGPVVVPRAWDSDRALTSCADAGRFAEWFTSTTVEEDWHQHIWTIPVGRIYEVVDEARRRADCWSTFASLLESRLRG